MDIPKRTDEIFYILSGGQFICSNSTDNSTIKLYDIIDENYEILYEYFSAIGFLLEKGDEFYYFSRKNESKVDLERKLKVACKWIDILDFFETYNDTFVPGYSFTIHDIAVKIKVDAVLKNKVDGLRNVLKLDDKTPYDEVIGRMVEDLRKDGFIDIENEISKTYKILASFKYLKELVININIPEEVQNEIPE